MTTTSDDDGRFVIEKLPTRSAYVLSAYKRGLGVSATLMAHANVPVTLVLSRLYFERIHFRSAFGTPITVRGQLLPFGAFYVVATSMTLSENNRRMLRTMGLPTCFPDDEVAFFYAGAPHDGHPQRYRDWLIEFPGYLPETVKVERWPIAEWSEHAQQAVLTPDPSSSVVAYRVQFPSIAWPAAWGTMPSPVPEHPRVLVQFTGTRAVASAYPGKEVFTGPRGGAFSLSQVGFSTLEVSQEPHGEEVWLKPRWPKFGFAELRYAAPDSREDRGLEEVEVSIVDVAAAPVVIVWPGLARLGPLPYGEYEVRRRWAEDEEASGKLDIFGPIVIGDACTSYEWR